MTHGLIRQIEDLGYSVTDHETAHHLEMHAVRLTGEPTPLSARCESDREDAVYACARTLADMVGIRPEELPWGPPPSRPGSKDSRET